LTQSESDRERYAALGARNVSNNGNLKYDFRPPSAPPEAIRQWAQGHPLFVAASTMPPDEDDTVIAAYRAMPPGTRMLVAPRKPEKFDEAAEKLSAAGIDFVRRTNLNRDAPVLLLDTIGELASCFALDCVVFMGGSIVTWGGHNILEPAIFGRPVVSGPYMQNFAEIDREFRDADAIRYVRNAQELATVVTELLENPGEMGTRARQLAESRGGATARAVSRLHLGSPLTHRPFPWFWHSLSLLWRAGVALDRKFTRRHRLARPVISIGGLAMGGVGKTPFVLWLAEELRARGIRPGILMRGYGRRAAVPLALPAGAAAPVAQTGDEAQLYLQSGAAAIGVGADRVKTAKMLESDVDVFLLDDGFQHWALERDMDIVLLDALDPNAGGGVFPAGYLREGPAALTRADLVVTPEKIALNPPPPGRYSAFCGIGNPASFRRTLELAGVEITEWRTFSDHHSYTVKDLYDLSEPMITTEKDAVKLPVDLRKKVHVLRIGLQVPDAEKIVDDVIRRISG